MSNAPYMYVLILIGFLVGGYFLTKFNQGVVDRGVANAKQTSQMPELANMLGLKHEDIGSKEKDKKTIMDMGERLTGEYEGIPLEIVMAMKAQHMDGKEVSLGYAHGYTYKSQRTIIFKVSNPDGKKFHIMPKSSHIVAEPTGNRVFDECLALTGDRIVPDELLSYFGEMGWMNLKLEGDTLVFNDNFHDQFKGMAAMKLMTVSHPVWKTSGSHPSMDLNNIKDFIDKLVDFAKKKKLV